MSISVYGKGVIRKSFQIVILMAAVFGLLFVAWPSGLGAEGERVEELKQFADELNGRSVTIAAKAEEDRLYGSVGPREIVTAIETEHKVKVPESAVVMEAPFKTLGTPDVTLRLADGAEAIVKVWIVAESE